MRTLILDTARRLTLEGGSVPSLNVLAAAAGVSKGGLTHHFPTRSSLIAGLGRFALEEVDAAMSLASSEGHAARTWLELSVLEDADRAVMQALAADFRATDVEARAPLADAASAIERWEGLIAAEVGGAVQARVIRLVGDALVANALIGLEPEQTDLRELVAHLTEPGARR